MPNAPTEIAVPRPPRARFARGMRLGMPIFLGYLPIGMAFGIAATSIGFNTLEAWSCSALVLAGAGQLMAVQVLGLGAGLVAVLVTTAVVNLRYVLFSATIGPHLRGFPRWQQALLAFTLTDETFAVNMTDVREGRADAWSMLGVGAISWIGWTVGTLAGAFAGSAIGDPRAWGVDFAMTAMFTALLVGQMTRKREVAAAGVAAAVALALALFVETQWAVIAGALAAATIMTVVPE